ncbi:MAG TPA: hypothetical protein VHU89_07705 [Acidobacteriaceae bacterium]|jgi:hypothetical protein|nr:hypothetical protein [Acidobacteriaceae bacterium]
MTHSSSDKIHPQSGSHTDPAPGTRAHNEKAAAQQPQTSVHPVEPEDPKATGTSQSQKRALDLNVGRQREADNAGHPGHQAEEHPATPAGQHATGSFTDRKSSKTA